MQVLAYAVTYEGANHGEAVCLHIRLDRMGDVRDSVSLTCEFDAFEKALLRDVNQPLRLVGDPTAGKGGGTVAVKALVIGPHVH